MNKNHNNNLIKYKKSHLVINKLKLTIKTK